MRRNLIVVRAGDASLHPEWIRNCKKRNFDLFVSYYGSTPGRFEELADYYESVRGFKWPALARLLETTPDLFRAYEACWFPDDDLAADCKTICRMFDLFRTNKLWLAQPALAQGSHLSHWITAAVDGSKLRFTNFAEIMCPILNRDALSRVGGSFRESVSGWGLDFLWPKLLGYPEDRIAILDETPVIHSRPVGSGKLYQLFSGASVDPKAEMQRITQKYGLPDPPRFRTHRTVSTAAR